MDVSVMIATWNNSRSLARTLEAITKCTVPAGLEWELIVVNNNCTDDTDNVVAAFGDRLPIVYVHEPEQGVSRARNTGLEAASGRLVIFTDDDVKPCLEWLAIYWSAYLQTPSGFYFGGPVQSEFEVEKPDDELLRLAPPSVRGLDFGPQPRKLASNEFLIGANWGCPGDALRSAGWFDLNTGLNPAAGEVRTGPETDLMMRLQRNGLAGWYLPEAVVIHFVPGKKCTLEHIAARAEANGAYQARLSLGNRSVRTVGGIPRWMYPELARCWLQWKLARLRGAKGYREYVAFRRMVGFFRPYRQKILGVV
jgi:glycosyltransferase involved in cell wall biosynthesis